MTASRLSYRYRICRRGAASVETVVVLPVFILIFISLFYVRDQVLTKQAAQERARTCAWLYSWNNCEFNDDVMPAECKDVVAPGPMLGQASADVTQKLVGDGVVADVVKKMLDPVLEAAFGRSL